MRRRALWARISCPRRRAHARVAAAGLRFFLAGAGHDLSEPVRPCLTSPPGACRLTRLERVLSRREPGGSFQLPSALLFSAAFVGLLTWKLPQHDSSAKLLWNFAALIVLQMTTTIGMQRATRGATRDMLARPLLGALPISPSDTLRSKSSALGRALLAVASPIVLVLAPATARHPAGTLGWRVAATLLAVWIYAAAATYVAFLTAGLGSTRPRGESSVRSNHSY